MRDVILAAVDLGQDSRFPSLLAECRDLCRAAGFSVKVTIVQKARSLDPQTAFRSGKLEEVRRVIDEEGTDLLIFYNRLSFAMLKGLQDALGIEVYDRVQLILNIFEKRASSREARLQIEAARLRYAMPRRTQEKGSEDQSGGTLHNRGAGESRSALTARRNRARIAQLEKELSALRRREEEKHRKRRRSGLKRVALVGYTNAGKSTLLNAFLPSEKGRAYAEDMLFATLDTTARRVALGHYEIYLFDTVGFVSDLPHELIEAFYSTLSCVREADLLLIVNDVSSPEWEQQREITRSTLQTIGAGDIPCLDIYNKSDLLPEGAKLPLSVSALTGEGLEELKDTLIGKLYPKEKQARLRLPYQGIRLLDGYRSVMEISVREEDEEGILLEASGREEYVNSLLKAAQDLGQGIMDDQVGIFVLGSGITVDDDQVAALEVTDEAGSRPDSQGSAADH